MRTIQPEELKTILESHAKWLCGEGGERANLRGASLRDANLRGASLRDADLSDADLSSANLYCANLSRADLIGADLSRADLIGANLSRADLIGANLYCADLSSANLYCADLRGADLSDADLRNANLSSANLRGANLNGGVGNMEQIKSLQLEEWPVTYTAERLQIGCQNHTIDEWRTFTDSEIQKMDEKALGWWSKYKALIFLTIETSPAEPTGASV